MSLLLVPIFEKVKSDFCGLVDYKLRGDTIEIITAIPTITNSYVSVFVSHKEGKYIVSDGGWVNTNMYEGQVFDDGEIVKRVQIQYAEHFRIKETKSPLGVIFYYKTTTDINLVSALVYDVGHYVAAIVNTQNVIYREVEDEDKKLFHNRMNGYLRKRFAYNQVDLNSSVNISDSQKIKFNAIVHANARDHYYLMYVSGSRPSNFIKDLTEATVNYEIINELGVKKEYFKKLAFVNTSAQGYDRDRAGIYIKKLANALERDPIMVKNNNDTLKLAEAIPV